MYPGSTHMSLRRDCCDKTVLLCIQCELLNYLFHRVLILNDLTRGCMDFTIFRHPTFQTSFRRRPFADFLPLRQNNARIPAPPPTPFGDVLRHIPTVTHTLTTSQQRWCYNWLLRHRGSDERVKKVMVLVHTWEEKDNCIGNHGWGRRGRHWECRAEWLARNGGCSQGLEKATRAWFGP